MCAECVNLLINGKSPALRSPEAGRHKDLKPDPVDASPQDLKPDPVDASPRRRLRFEPRLLRRRLPGVRGGGPPGYRFFPLRAGAVAGAAAGLVAGVAAAAPADPVYFRVISSASFRASAGVMVNPGAIERVGLSERNQRAHST